MELWLRGAVSATDQRPTDGLACRAVDHKNQRLGPPFSPYILTSADVYDLKEEIFNKLPQEARKHVVEHRPRQSEISISSVG